ncbi:MAG: cobS [Acidimicrobiales bacterium]|nr:cobS [Acidimicrobiales bacterium]
MNGLRAATAFLTRVPVGSTDVETDVARSLPWFPVVGAVLGVVSGAIYAGMSELLSPLPAAAVAVAVGVALTGAFHEDGLANTADALGASEPTGARRILEDPTHGTYGVAALVLVLVVRVSAVSALGSASGVAVLVAAHAIARAAALSLIGVLPVATEDGLGASFAARVRPRDLLVVVAVAAGLAVAATGVWGLPAMALAFVGALAVGSVAAGRIGGVTGDVLGAAEQVAETVVVLYGAIVVTQGWPGLPWWR